MPAVLDACAMIAFLRGEEGADAVEALLATGPGNCAAHAVNLCEVYYDFLRVADERTAQEAITALGSTGLATREDLDPAFWQAAGRFKARFRFSLADAFVLALARRLGADLVTSDHEFDAVAKSGICGVRFIR